MKSRCLVAVLALSTAHVASAQDVPSLKLSPILLVDDRNHASGPNERTVALGEPVLDLALVFKSAATITAPKQSKTPAWVPANMLALLREAVMQPGDPRALPGVPVYCTREFTLTEKAGETYGPAAADFPLGEDLRACFMDTDADGSFDSIFAPGDRSGRFATPQPLEPLTYKAAQMVPIGDARWRIVAKQEDRTRSLGALGLLSQRHVFQAQTNGARGQYDEVVTSLVGGACGETSIPIDTGLKTNRLPRTYKFGCAEIEVTGYDKSSKRLTYRIAKAMSEQPVSLRISFLDIYGGTIYTLD